MATDNMTKSTTPIGGALKDYYQTVRDSYKASRELKKTRSEAQKDARKIAKDVWAADKKEMQETGWLRKKDKKLTGRSTPVHIPAAAPSPTAQAPSGGFRFY